MFLAAVLLYCSIYFILLQLSAHLQESSETGSPARGICGAYANFRRRAQLRSGLGHNAMRWAGITVT